MTVKKAKTTKKSAPVKKAVKNSWELTTVPLHSWIIFWVLILATMALATVCFTSAFKNSEGEVDQETVEAFEAIRESLEDQIEDLQEKVGVTQPQPFSYADLVDRLEDECLSPEGGSVDTSNAPLTYVNYTDPDTSVRMTLPYSFGWGTVNCPPVQTHLENAILFGPSYRGEGGAGRESAIVIEAPSSTAAIRASIERSANSEEKITGLRQRTINGLTVLSYTHSFPLGSANVWVAIGRTHVYRIMSHSWLTDAEAIKIIQSLRVEN